MSIVKTCFSLLPMIPIVIATTAMAEIQCVSIGIPKFNLFPDSNCSISTSKLRSKLPGQVFLYDLGIPADQSCFIIVDPSSWESSVDGYISNLATEDELPITVSLVAGLTQNAYPPRDPSGTVSFTAASIVSIKTDGVKLGSLVTRDAGTVFADGFANNVAARLSVVKGTGNFKKKISGYIDEVGQEFNPAEPASATGTLCGKNLADSLFNDD